ncbi:17590_t:CDS:2 [Cetraspora pellucida]|uniref:17590_t:CDS:1 n=1 Tax=Cetraspora pellucida TaxID=1433469 RepID=A0A9N9FGE6_9GLOM|nr:17590_t:CDS:2 [Cetraspora pellucida]
MLTYYLHSENSGRYFPGRPVSLVLTCNEDSDCKETTLICVNHICQDSDNRTFNTPCSVDNACASKICWPFSNGLLGCTRLPGDVCNADEECPQHVCVITCVESDNRSPGQLCIVHQACGPNGLCINNRCAQDNDTLCTDDTNCKSLVCGKNTTKCQDRDERNLGDPCLIGLACKSGLGCHSQKCSDTSE